MNTKWIMLAIILLMSGCSTVPPVTATDAAPPVPVEYQSLSAVEQQLGLRVEALHLVSAGYMLDFRYYVWDRDKAMPMLDKEVHPYLMHHRTGAYLGIPAPEKIGSLRQRPRAYYPDRVYFMLFANPGGLVEVGDKVDIVIGDYQFKDLTVE